MNKLSILCFIALAVLSRAAFSTPICSNLVDTSRDLIANLFISLATSDEAGVQKAFIDFETQLTDLRLCSSYLSSSVYVPLASHPATCQLVMDDLLTKVDQYLENGTTGESETIQMLRYLMEKSSVFATVCKLETQPKRIRGTPAPECLSQIYQSLSTLYSVSVDSMNQDASDLESDFQALTPITSNINDLCGQQIVFDNTKPSDGNCNTDFTDISSVMKSYKSADPTDPVNVLQTLQDLWSIYPNFKNNCLVPKVAVVVVTVSNDGPLKRLATVPREDVNPKCLEAYGKAMNSVLEIFGSAGTNDFDGLSANFRNLGSTIFEINSNCDANLHIRLFSGVGVAQVSCQEATNAMKELFVNLDLERTEVVQRVWDMRESLASSC